VFAFVVLISTAGVSHLARYPALLWLSALLKTPYYFLMSAALTGGAVYALYGKGWMGKDVPLLFLCGVIASVLSSVDVLYRWSFTPLQDTYLLHVIAGISAVLYWLVIKEWSETQLSTDGLHRFAWFGGVLVLLGFLAGVTRRVAGGSGAQTIEIVTLTAVSNLVYFALLYVSFKFYGRRLSKGHEPTAR